MKTIIAGSRTLVGVVGNEMSNLDIEITEVVSGRARGVDRDGEAWAKENNIPVTLFPAAWDTHGKAAGPIRNKQMAEYADILVLIWDGSSRGSANMKRQMESLDKPVIEIIKEI